ncbi:MAG: hypothetical protein QOC82_2543 [Frankiaceae bacterium]|jgi:hypothetical protein|nr:hypothetical protein [Frankiaceae bacterium]
MSQMTTPTTPERVARPKSLRDSLLDMGRSLGLMAVIMAIVVFGTPVRDLIWPSSQDRMPATDYSGVVAGFKQVTHHSGLAPVGLPSSWRANAANLTGTSAKDERLHIGFATPGSRYAGVDETTGDPNALIADVLGKRGATTSGTTTIEGVTWDLRTSDLGERSLTRTADGLTVVVTGNAKSADLDRLCASLRATG